MLNIIDDSGEMNDITRGLRNSDLISGFIPTMGALHQGHLSLISECKSKSSVCIVSIFVNPLQFNESEDYTNYPRSLEEDIEKLRKISCDYLFLPSEKDIYPDEKSRILKYDPGYLEDIYEGKVRPGHFKGVAVVVKRLFDIIQADYAFFGQKDYQQFLIIKKLVSDFRLDVNLQLCKIIRDTDGLALSSRNRFLTKEQRKDVPVIYQTLKMVEDYYQTVSINKVKQDAINKIGSKKDFKVEYFDICNAYNLMPVKDWNEAEQLVVITAVRLPGLRLIDNILINK